MNKSFDNWLSTASTSTLEANLRTARTTDEARRIREELQNRKANQRDTGTMELFDTGRTAILLVASALLLNGCVGTILEGFKEAGEASGLGGRKARPGELLEPCCGNRPFEVGKY